MYKISIQYTNSFKRYRTETKSVTYGTDVRTDSGDTICPPPPPPPPPPPWRGHENIEMTIPPTPLGLKFYKNVAFVSLYQNS